MSRIYGLNRFKTCGEDSFIYAAENGLKAIEIHLDKIHPGLEWFDNSEIDELNLWSEKYNVRINLHNPYNLNVSDIIPRFRKNDTQLLFKSLKTAKSLNASHITSHIGSFYWFPVERWMRKKALYRFVQSMENVLDKCIELKIPFALENVVQLPHGTDYYFLGDQIEDFHYLFENLNNDYFKFCLDTGHANVGDGVVGFLQNFGDRLQTIHFHDNHGNNDDHLPIGTGSIDWYSVAAEIKKIDFNGPFISECRDLKPHEAANKLENYFKGSS